MCVRERERWRGGAKREGRVGYGQRFKMLGEGRLSWDKGNFLLSGYIIVRVQD